MKAKKNPKPTFIPSIFTRLKEDLHVALANVQEVAGHDDSLPFRAILMVSREPFDAKRVDAFKKSFVPVALASDDGWGGEVQLTAFGREVTDVVLADVLVEEAEEVSKRHRFSYEGKDIGPCDLRYICGLMAERQIYTPNDPKILLKESLLDDDPRIARGEVLAYDKRRA